MQTRRFGRTGHQSSLAIFGGFAAFEGTPDDAAQLLETVKAAGVNHIDIAPSYGEAEANVGPWLAGERQNFFVGCKTMERTREGAWREMHESLERLQTEAFDLYQIHAITTMEELDAATGPGGVLEAIIEAREQGLTRYIGITGHGHESPEVFLEALRRFDFDTVLFPVNFVLYARPNYRQKAEELLRTCRQKDVGVMAIKAIAKAPWGERQQEFLTWYEPFTDPAKVQQAVNFTLSQDVTGYCMAGDPGLVPLLLEACENFTPLGEAEQAELVAQAGEYATIF